MRIAITGGTGFVGRHLAKSLVANGHDVVIIARGFDQRDQNIRHLTGAQFIACGLGDTEKLVKAFAGCDAVAHCAGINREIGGQTYYRVHVEGTRHVIEAAKTAAINKIVLLSFLRARSNCNSPYHESKWAAEELIRTSGLDYTVIKSGMIYGRGDHMLDHLSHMLYTMPLFAKVGCHEKPVRPVAVEDIVNIMQACLVEGRLSEQTVAVTGPQEMLLSEAVRKVAGVLNINVKIFALPVWAHYGIAGVLEKIMKIPLVAKAQVKILSEGVVEAHPACDQLPEDLKTKVYFTDEQIIKGLPEPGPFHKEDLQWACP